MSGIDAREVIRYESEAFSALADKVSRFYAGRGLEWPQSFVVAYSAMERQLWSLQQEGLSPAEIDAVWALARHQLNRHFGWGS